MPIAYAHPHAEDPPKPKFVSLAPLTSLVASIPDRVENPVKPIVFTHGDISWLPELASKAGWEPKHFKKLGEIILRESGGCPNRKGGDKVDKNCNITGVSEWNHRSDTGLIAGPSIGTTNDMPIVEVPTLQAMAWLPFNLNPHYLDAQPGGSHMGETREQRIAEFHAFHSQPVVGLREGSWLTSNGIEHQLCGPHSARIFSAGQAAVECPPGPLRF